ncbi:MAG: flavin reductase [Pseudomonadota bacterium]
MLERTENRSAVSPEEYRDAMSNFAGAVSIAATDGVAGRRGLTVAAAVSVSDDPPTVLICLNRNWSDNLMFEQNGCFSLNTLRTSQIDLARAFAGEGDMSMESRFALGKWYELHTGAPILNSARTAIDCEVIDVQSVHTHYVVFGRVVACAPSTAGPALIYLDRDYREL